MRIDKINLDLYIEVPELFDNLGLTTEQAASSVMGALAMVLSNALAGIAIQTAETLTEDDEWLAEQAKLAQGCGHCEGCKARAALEGEWAEANGFVI